MVRLMGFELKKMYFNKFLIITLGIFMLINIYKIVQISQQDNTEVYGHEELYSRLKGTITEDRISFVVDNYKKYSEIIASGHYSVEEDFENTYTGYVMGDYNEFEHFFNEYERLYNYGSLTDELCESARENVEFFGKLNNQYEMSRNKKISVIYSNRQLTEYYDTKGEQQYFEYDFSTLLMFLIILTAVSRILIIEKQNKMYYILETSKMGIVKNVIAKLVSMAVFILSIIIVFAIEDFIVFSCMYELDGLHCPVYAMADYKHAPVNYSIIEYMIIGYFQKYNALLFFAMVVFLISLLTMDGIKTMITGLSFYVVMMYVAKISKTIFNPIALLVNFNFIKEFGTVNVFGNAIEYGVLVNIIVALFSIMLGAIICVISGRKKMSVASSLRVFGGN